MNNLHVRLKIIIWLPLSRFQTPKWRTDWGFGWLSRPILSGILSLGIHFSVDETKLSFFEWWKKIRKKRTQREIWSMRTVYYWSTVSIVADSHIIAQRLSKQWLNDDRLNWKTSTLLDKGLIFYKILMKLFHVDLIFMLEIEGEGLSAKIKNSGIPTICLFSIHRHSKVSLK